MNYYMFLIGLIIVLSIGLIIALLIGMLIWHKEMNRSWWIDRVVEGRIKQLQELITDKGTTYNARLEELRFMKNKFK